MEGLNFKNNIRSSEEAERRGRPFAMTGGTAKEREQATDVLISRRTRAIRERPESSEDMETEKMLGVINQILDSELKRLDLVDPTGHTAFKPISIKEVQGVRDVFNGDAGDMVYDDMLDIVQYKLGQNKLKKFVGLLHEGIHTTQSTEFSPMWKSRGASAPEPAIVRGGYMTGEAYREGSPTYWKWLNEGVVHGQTLRLIESNIDLLVEKFPGTTTQEWLSQDKDMYEGSQRLVSALEERYSSHARVGIEEMHDDFFRRHVTGDMSHLEKIDQIFGEGVQDKLERVHYQDLDSGFESATEGIFSEKTI